MSVPLVSVYDGKIVQTFDQPSDKVMLEPPAALVLADKLQEAAYAVMQYVTPSYGVAKHEAIERHRLHLTKRVEVMLNGHRENRRVSNAALAKEVVEKMLKEVFA